jgi:hypothetical protein
LLRLKAPTAAILCVFSLFSWPFKENHTQPDAPLANEANGAASKKLALPIRLTTVVVCGLRIRWVWTNVWFPPADVLWSLKQPPFKRWC